MQRQHRGQRAAEQCGDNDNVTPNNVTPNNVTPNNGGEMMLPIALQQTMDENCISCHQPGGIAPFDFTHRDTVVSVGELIATAVQNGTMPPWNADPECADPTPLSPPARGFAADEVECGIELEDCEAQYGVDATECAIDYSSRLRINALDPAFSHMHLTGERIEAEVMRVDDDGTTSVPREAEPECVARTDQWDFDWQRTYWFEQQKRIPRQGMVRLRCRHDNSGSDAEVRLGEGSGDEMCLALFYLTL